MRQRRNPSPAPRRPVKSPAAGHPLPLERAKSKLPRKEGLRLPTFQVPPRAPVILASCIERVLDEENLL
jgi:hypothetical protein